MHLALKAELQLFDLLYKFVVRPVGFCGMLRTCCIAVDSLRDLSYASFVVQHLDMSICYILRES